MKQRITIEQISELSEKGREKLNGWSSLNGHFYKPFEYPPLLSIGEMIEFLCEDLSKRKISLNISFDSRYGSGQFISFDDGTTTLWEYDFENKELCNALWEAVKEVLESLI